MRWPRCHRHVFTSTFGATITFGVTCTFAVTSTLVRSYIAEPRHANNDRVNRGVDERRERWMDHER
jgi:hypothetical protein